MRAGGAFLCVACGLRPCRILRFAWIHCEQAWRSAAIQQIKLDIIYILSIL